MNVTVRNVITNMRLMSALDWNEFFESVSFVFFFKQKTAYEIRKGDWSSDECSSDLPPSRRCRGSARLRRALGARARVPETRDRDPGAQRLLERAAVEALSHLQGEGRQDPRRRGHGVVPPRRGPRRRAEGAGPSGRAIPASDREEPRGPDGARSLDPDDGDPDAEHAGGSAADRRGGYAPTGARVVEQRARSPRAGSLPRVHSGRGV